jgi:hypothetical protein
MRRKQEQEGCGESTEVTVKAEPIKVKDEPME